MIEEEVVVPGATLWTASQEWPRNESIFRAINQSFQALVARGLEDRVRRLEAPIQVIHARPLARGDSSAARGIAKFLAELPV